MSEPKVKTGDKEKGIFTILYDFFRSLKLTIFLLILLAVLSIIGTLITQNAAPEDYIRRYGGTCTKSSISLACLICTIRGGSVPFCSFS